MLPELLAAVQLRIQEGKNWEAAHGSLWRIRWRVEVAAQDFGSNKHLEDTGRDTEGVGDHHSNLLWRQVADTARNEDHHGEEVAYSRAVQEEVGSRWQHSEMHIVHQAHSRCGCQEVVVGHSQSHETHESMVTSWEQPC